MKKIYLTILCQMLFLPLVLAQIPANELGLNPLSLKWSQIKTDKVRVVFPRNLEKQGQRVANIVHYLWSNSNESIGNKMKPITIFLQNQTVAPNGFVTPGPYRSEFYLAPPQFLFNGPSDWLDMLAIHEYRHAKQFSNSIRGVTRLAKTLLGSWPWGGVIGAVLPRWYFEGDAVVSETALSNNGRGRQPGFNMEYRTLLTNGIKYGYEKAGAGSLNDFVPDHYNLGYHMINYGRRKYGETLWAGVMQDAVRYRGLFYPFSRSLKRRTGLTTKHLYKQMVNELDSVWQAENTQLTYTPTTQINQKKKRTVVNYQFPHVQADGSLVVLKDGYNEVKTYYKLLPDGTEKRLTLSGINFDVNTSLSVNGGKMCWAEMGYHARWGLKNYSVIKLYDLKTQRKKKITHRSRYFAPALSPDGSKIIAVEISTNLTYSLVVLDTEGKVLKKLANPHNYFYSFPRWADNDHIVVVRQQKEQNQLRRINTNSGQTTALTNPTSVLIAYPYAQGDYVFFMGAYTGINNIFVVKQGSRQVYQVSSVKQGAFYPHVSPDGKTLYMSEFSPKGYNVSKMPLKPADWKVVQNTQTLTGGTDFYKTISEQEGGSIFDKVGEEKFKVKKYNKWTGIINPHSLIFSVLHPEYGARLLFDNKFSTLSANVGAFYNTNERTVSYGANLRYAELYPVIKGSYQRLNRNRINANSTIINDTTITFGLNEQKWQEDRYSAGLELPINFSGGSNFNRMRLSATFHQISVNFDNEDTRILQFDTLTGSTAGQFARQNLSFEPLQKTSMQALELRFTNNMQQQRALQHINPRFWLYWDLRYRTTLNTDINSGNVFLGIFNLYLPGFAKNHSMYFSTAFQAENFSNAYKFVNYFPYSRGYGSWFEDNATKYGFNYTFPIAYPDVAIGPLLFFKRIKANLFYDVTRLNSDLIDAFNGVANTRLMQSTGVELTFNVRALRLLEIDMGVRYSYLLDADIFGIANPHKFDFLLFSIGI
ncbi:hypothetical protein [uncultured Microscilla sp.]|uniref:TolB family protein n=1 Tax=uncultured Microscilla sp. TaxID=432653 RepID=UPI002623ED65|nr:hypothetical protein [uncultured Microscilla sp.]